MSVKTGFDGHLGSFGLIRVQMSSEGLKRAQTGSNGLKLDQTTSEYSSGVDLYKHTRMFANGHIGPYWAILSIFAIWAVLRGWLTKWLKMAQNGSKWLKMAQNGSKYYKHHLCMVKHMVQTHITYTCTTDH